MISHAPESAQRQSAEAIRRRLSRVIRQGDSLERTRAMLAYLQRLSREDFPASAAALRDLNLPVTAPEFELLLTAWAKIDREAALTFAAGDREALRIVLNDWSSKEPGAAHAWVMANRQQSDPDPLLGIVLPALARTDEAGALKLIGSLPREDRWYVFRQMAPDLAREGHEAVETWLAKLPTELRGEAVAQVVHELPPARVEEAVDWLERYPDGLMTANLAGLFRELAIEDEARAKEAFLAAPEGRLRQEAMRGLVVEWSLRGKLNEALQAMEAAPAEVDDAMLEAWALQAMKRQPREALEQVLQVQDSTLREEAGRKILSRWRSQDASAAQAWQGVATTITQAGH